LGMPYLAITNCSRIGKVLSELVTIGVIDPVAWLDPESDKWLIRPELEDLAKNHLRVVMPVSALGQGVADGLAQIVEIGLGRHGGTLALVGLNKWKTEIERKFQRTRVWLVWSLGLGQMLKTLNPLLDVALGILADKRLPALAVDDSEGRLVRALDGGDFEHALTLKVVRLVLH